MGQTRADTAGTRRLDEFQYEAILLAPMLHHEPGPIVLRIAQHGGNCRQPEAGLLYLVGLEGLVDTMQRVGVARARAGHGAVVDDAIDAARLKRPENGRVDFRA